MLTGGLLYNIILTSTNETEQNKMTKLTTKAQFGTIREVKEEDKKFYAWNEKRNEWYRIPKTKVQKVSA
jgi:hypothetical protein